jgi:hypothetical protein
MAIFFNRQSLPPIEDLITALMSANQFLHPDWNEQETIFNSIHAVRTLGSRRNGHKRIANYVNEVCNSAVIKLDEVNQLEQQLQLNTDINN